MPEAPNAEGTGEADAPDVVCAAHRIGLTFESAVSTFAAVRET
jgi:hypothetical protein